jgi:exopolyphosphatase/guanosine-5'-triphosphate,3'-diphosphate pyrophosphatase
LRHAGGTDLHRAENLHEVRLAVKRLRYGMELFGSCFDDGFRRACHARLIELQDRLGAFNDLVTLDAVLEARAEQPSAADGGPRGQRQAAGLAALRETVRKQLAAAHAEALAAWTAFDVDDFVSRFEQSIRPDLSLHGRIEPKLRPRRRAAGAQLNGHASRGAEGHPERIAAIDVGTNSLRLIIAEVTASGAYRVLDDEKEVTRLGRGLHESGRLDPEAIAHSVAAIARMQSIAAGYGVSRLKVVATAAAREASNPGDLVRAVAEQTGLELEIITAEQEAMLAHRSASRAFDLRSVCAAVLDVGGGSTEVVLSVPRPEPTVGAPSPHSAPEGGRPIIERVYTIPLGAVRLTERFGGPEAACGRNFRDMRRFVKSVVKQHIGRPPAIPQIVIGTGGTITTLGAVSIHRELNAADSSLFAGVVQGHDVPRADLRHIIDYLRKLPLKDRARVPGLSSDRADIIVPGLVIVDAVLRRLDANRVRIHEGGIRDGLLLSMLGPPAASAAAPESGAAVEDPIGAVRRFARACAYEEPHSLHVAGLARRIFDQLLPALPPTRSDGEPWFAGDAARARQLLEAAAILHDVGYLINYAAHHKHSYHLILHADLPGWSAREIQVIAHVARYHRCGQPKRKHRAFAMLERADRRLVRELAGILRIADGFDRTHTQLISDVRLQREGDDLLLEVTAGHEPSVDLWGAARKSGLFERAFRLRPRFEWRGTASPPPAALSGDRSLISV